MIHCWMRRRAVLSALGAAMMALGFPARDALADPVVTRLTPPSNLFASGESEPVVARFLPGQRFDLQATITTDPGQTIDVVQFIVDGLIVNRPVSRKNADTGPLGATIATTRAYSLNAPGVHTLMARAIQSDGKLAVATGNFEIVKLENGTSRARNIIVLIGDGMGIAHRTAARILALGASQGKVRGKLAMDEMPVSGMVITHSLNSIVTDSSPGSACYSSGNKSNNNQHGVFPDDTLANFDNPRVEYMAEYLARTQGKSLGIVTTSDVFDATPAAWASHTQSRGAGTGICDQYLDDSGLTGLSVILGGGRKWFLPNTTPGSARSAGTDYALDSELHSAWGIAPGAVDPARDLLQDFVNAGWVYAPDGASLAGIPANTTKLLGLFALSNMNVALDKIDGRRGTSTIVNEYGFPDQPLLEEMTQAALEVLNKNSKGFVLMVEGASIDKQAHNMDTERWILDTIEFDRALAVCQDFAEEDRRTLIVVTADHECAGVNLIGGSRVTDAALQARIATGGGAAQVRNGVVGTYESAGFPSYEIADDGYPVTTDVDFRLIIGYAANADRFEDWRTNPLPLRDGQQPFNNVPPLNTYPSGPLNRDLTGNFLVTGQVADGVAAHTASDIPCSAQGPGAWLFTGVMDNTDIFFKAMQVAIRGAPPITGIDNDK